MNYSHFIECLNANEAPEGVSKELVSMWHDAKGDWTTAHIIIQDEISINAAWVHAYLHRKEPDEWNASYWYSRAGRNKPDTTLEQEWQEIVRELTD